MFPLGRLEVCSAPCVNDVKENVVDFLERVEKTFDTGECLSEMGDKIISDNICPHFL